MGVRSITEVLKVKPRSIEEMQSISEWLRENLKEN